MSLAVALNTARTSLLTTAKQIAVSGANVANAADPSRTRKLALPTTDADGAVHVVSVGRATDLPLFYRLLDSNAAVAGQEALLDGIERLHQTIGDPVAATSPAARVAALATALQTQANAPGDANLARATLTAAAGVVETLANASQTVLAVRSDADTAMALAVDRLNDLLAEFTVVNTVVVRGTFAGDDVTDALDRRDALLGKISTEAGVTVVQRQFNDVALYTDGGVTLFDKSARTVSFEPSTALGPGVVGNPVVIDGVPVTGANATMPLISGNLAGLSALRDDFAPTYQAQMDELARGLIETFAEHDQSGGGGPDLAGLFIYPGGPALPASGTLSPGLALSISVNPAVDPAAGGSLTRLRDGGINGPAYVSNPTGAASFADRLNEMLAAVAAGRPFDAASGLQSGVGVVDFATASVSWLEDRRQTAAHAADYQNTLLARTSEALSNATGVNIDQEYALQLQLEQSYAASSKLIAVINAMFETLLEAV